ncbi:hypothetical protein TWF281_001024 [Arthrobotrys megalospora]
MRGVRRRRRRRKVRKSKKRLRRRGEGVQEGGAETPEGRLTREKVLEEALDRFDKRKPYEEKVKAWRRSIRIDTVTRGVTRGLIEGGHNSPNSARAKSSRLRKQINAEQELEKFIQGCLAEIIQRNPNRQAADAEGEGAAAAPGTGLKEGLSGDVCLSSSVKPELPDL